MQSRGADREVSPSRHGKEGRGAKFTQLERHRLGRVSGDGKVHIVAAERESGSLLRICSAGERGEEGTVPVREPGTLLFTSVLCLHAVSSERQGFTRSATNVWFSGHVLK